MTPLNVGVVGTGMIATAHCDEYSKNPKARLTAVVDPIAERRNDFSKKYRATPLDDYHDLLRDDSINLVSICTPDYTHAQIAIDSLNAGKHVVSEKPMAMTLEDCDAIIEAAKTNKRRFIVDFEYRVNPFFLAMKDSIDGGQLGETKAMSIYYWRHPFRIKPQRWIHKSKYTSMMLQEGCHYADIFRWFCGDVEKVLAWSTSVRGDIEFDQLLFGELWHENGVHSQYSHTIIGNQIRHNVWLVGTKGTLNGEMVFSKTDGSFARIVSKQHKSDITEDIKEDYSVTCFGEKEIWDDYVIGSFLDCFLTAIIDKKDSPLTPIDGRKSIELALALEYSARLKKEVHLPLKSTPDSVRVRTLT